MVPLSKRSTSLVVYIELIGCTYFIGLTFEQILDGQVQTYQADSELPITDVGESTPTSGGALVCRTDRTDCCHGDPMAGETKQGDWIYSNGDLVDNSGSGDAIYRTRGSRIVLLNRRNDATGPTGQYCCEVASVADPDARLCINLSKIN